MVRYLAASLAVLGLVASACASGPNVGRSNASPNPASYIESPSQPVANAGIVDPSGRIIGLATFRESRLGVRVEVKVQDLPAGKHGVHMHAAGKCDGPEFASAGGHFNPNGKAHGLAGSIAAHAGDLPNLEVAADGKGQLLFFSPHLSLNRAASNGLAFGPGTAIVIHANADDETTDPSGNSGGRIACGIVKMNP